MTLKLAGHPCRRQKGRGKRDAVESGSLQQPPCYDLRETGAAEPLDSWARTAGSGGQGAQDNTLALCPVFGSSLSGGFQVLALHVGRASGRGCLLATHGTHHHASGPQRVTGTLEVVPADAVELAHVVASWVVDAVEIREAAGVKPPSWQREGKTLWGGGGQPVGWGRPSAPGTNQGCCLLQGGDGQGGMGTGVGGRLPDPLLSLWPLEGGTWMVPSLCLSFCGTLSDVCLSLSGLCCPASLTWCVHLSFRGLHLFSSSRPLDFRSHGTLCLHCSVSLCPDVPLCLCISGCLSSYLCPSYSPHLPLSDLCPPRPGTCLSQVWRGAAPLSPTPGCPHLGPAQPGEWILRPGGGTPPSVFPLPSLRGKLVAPVLG